MEPNTYDPNSAEARACLSHALGVHTICPSPTNPRKTFPEEEQAEMVESVRRHGVLQPILVRVWPHEYGTPEGWAELPLYELIAGERRFRAAKAAGLQLVPGMVKHLSTREVLEIQVIENLCRKDLHPLEEAEGYELMMKEHGYSADELAEKIGKSRAYIYGRLKLTALCPAAREAFRDGRLNPSTALLVARIPGAALQARATKEVTETTHWHPEGMAYREAATHIQQRYMLRLADAPFPRADAELVPAAGKCHPCPKRTGSNPELYPDVKSADICTDPDCFAAKKVAWQARQIEEAKAVGKRVIEGKEAEKVAPYGRYNMKGYTALDETNYDAGPRRDGKGYPTTRELLEGTGAETLVIRTPNGDIIEAVSEKALAEALQAAGIRNRTEEARASNKAQQAKLREEAAYREALFDGVRREVRLMLNSAGGRTGLYRAPDLALIARQFWARIGHDAQVRLAKLHIQPDEKLDNHERVRLLNTELDGFTAPQLVQFLFELALVGTVDMPSWGDPSKTPEPLLEAARSFGLDPDAIRVNVKSQKTTKTARPKASEGTPTPPEAPRGSEGGATDKAPAAKKAARAGGKSAGKNEVQAAGAARKNEGKAKKSGRASPAERKGKTDAKSTADAVPHRCDKTMDLIEAAFPHLKAGTAAIQAEI